MEKSKQQIEAEVWLDRYQAGEFPPSLATLDKAMDMMSKAGYIQALKEEKDAENSK